MTFTSIAANQVLVCGNRVLSLDQPVVMGILNVTPDSFSDGGQYNQLDAALERAQQMVAQGARVIDVGGESTRPGAALVSLQEELDRVIPIVDRISTHLDVIISVDTSRPEVMRQAVQSGAGMINDVRALHKPGALAMVAQLNVPVCLMHMQGEPDTMQQDPQYGDVTQDIIGYLKQRVELAINSGIKRNNIVLDPGFGFGKSVDHNLQLIAELDRFAALNLPVLIGVSRKSTIGKVLNVEVQQRLAGGLALAVLALERGANIFRVHDVEETVQALAMAAAVLAHRK